VQPARYVTLETIAPISDNPIIVEAEVVTTKERSWRD
jgi:hypothetical protein